MEHSVVEDFRLFFLKRTWDQGRSPTRMLSPKRMPRPTGSTRLLTWRYGWCNSLERWRIGWPTAKTPRQEPSWIIMYAKVNHKFCIFIFAKKKKMLRTFFVCPLQTCKTATWSQWWAYRQELGKTFCHRNSEVHQSLGEKQIRRVSLHTKLVHL